MWKLSSKGGEMKTVIVLVGLCLSSPPNTERPSYLPRLTVYKTSEKCLDAMPNLEKKMKFNCSSPYIYCTPQEYIK